MAQARHLSRDEEIQKIHRRYIDFYKIGGGLILVLIGIWIGSLLFSDGYATNVYTEVLSVIATIVVLDQINQWRDIQGLKKRLIREAGSQSNETAKAAVYQMWRMKWLAYNDDIQLLKGADLVIANLQDAFLEYANLQGVFLMKANLQGANLRVASLQDANLFRANLQKADLSGANLQEADLELTNLQDAVLIQANLQKGNLKGANLRGAKLPFANLQEADLGEHIFGRNSLKRVNLQDAILIRANLQDANLRGANLQGANLMLSSLRDTDLSGALFDENTVLPDANNVRDKEGNPLKDQDDNFMFDKYWTPETDMSRYTDPNHPDFWQPGWVKEDS